MDMPPLPSDLGGMLSRVMSDPAAMGQIMNIVNGMNNNTPIQPNFTNGPQMPSGDNQAGMNGDFSAMLGRLVSDPAVMGLVKELSSGGIGSMPDGTMREKDEANRNADTPPKQNGSVPAVQPRVNIREKERIALLCALKPYLGESRRKKIEGMVKLLELLEFARSTHLLDNLLPGIIN